MTRIRKVRLVLPARFAAAGPEAAREIMARMIDASEGAEAGLAGSFTLTDTGQTAAQIGLQTAQTARGRASRTGGGS